MKPKEQSQPTGYAKPLWLPHQTDLKKELADVPFSQPRLAETAKSGGLGSSLVIATPRQREELHVAGMAIIPALCVADFGNVFARPSARACRAPPCYGRNRPPMRPGKSNLQKCMRSAAVPAHAIFVNTRVSETLTASLGSRERERDAHAVRILMCCSGAERRYATL